MERTNKFFGIIIAILASLLIITALPTERDAEVYRDTVRIHILANSDGKEDQAVKLLVRDRLLKEYGSRLSAIESKSDAILALEELSPEIERDVTLWLKDEGFDYSGRVTIGEEWYERREYDGFALPEGYYTSLKVELGDSDGQNWWCVMYPPLCLDIATEDAPRDDAIAGYGDEAGALITDGKYTLKFKLLEIAGGFFGSFLK